VSYLVDGNRRKNFTVRLSDDELSMLEWIAEEQQLSRGATLRRLVHIAMDHLEQVNKKGGNNARTF
jgi:hypothetical protein